MTTHNPDMTQQTTRESVLAEVINHARALVAEGRWIPVADCVGDAGSGNRLRDALDKLDALERNNHESVDDGG